MKQFSNEIISKINTEIETSCTDSDISSDKGLHMINFIRPLFEPMPVPHPFKEREKPVPVPVERTGRSYTFKERKLTVSEQEYWQPYGITPEILEQYKVCSVVRFQSENAEGNPFSYSSSKEEPIYGDTQPHRSALV